LIFGDYFCFKDILENLFPKSGIPRWMPKLETVADQQIRVRRLIESGQASLDAEDSDKRTPLHWACAKGKNDVAEYLISKGANVNHKDDSGASQSVSFLQLVASILNFNT
jgi:hypothetical protein